MDSGNRDYTNGEITVFWRPSKCIHATTCYRDLIEVFNPRKRPWVNMEGAPSDRIIETVLKCPTEALEFKWNDAAKQEEWLNRNKEKEEQLAVGEDIPATEIRLMPDGPIVISGNFKVVGADGNDLRTMAMTSLCRCGGSNQMPFCDGTHRKIDFKTKE